MSTDLVELLTQTLNPTQSRQAEQNLKLLEKSHGFVRSLLVLVCNAEQNLAIRQAAALFFKNYVRRRWPEDKDSQEGIPDEDKNFIKAGIVQAMISLPTILQFQVAAAVTLIATQDFPRQWPTLVDDLVANFSQTDMLVTNGVLQTAHSIFKRWRAQFRSDDLFTEIAFVLDKFCTPFLGVYKQVDHFIEQNAANKDALIILFVTLTSSMKVFYDLNSQDIPEFFEDHITDFMTIMHKYLKYENELLLVENDELKISVEKTKASICEIAELYAQRYEEIFVMLPDFVSITWSLLSQISLQDNNDVLVGKGLSFLTCVVKNRRHVALFDSDEVLQQFVERIVLPNVSLRESDQELFEDDPIEYTRRDLDGADSDTRRRAATEFVRGLVEQFETRVTNIVMKYAAHYLQQYQRDSQNWTAKDTAIYLVTAIATKGAITKNGVTSTNPMIDVSQFLTENILSDLQAASSSVHPILKLDAIKYVQTFRNQLTKAQLAGIFPILVLQLRQSNYVVATYSAVTIEALLSMKREKDVLFSKQDIAGIAEDLIGSLFSLIERGESPEKIAENDFMMRCVMRVLISTQDAVVKIVPLTLEHLNGILHEVCKNPSNPNFNHYLFESYGALIRFCGSSSNETLLGIEALAIGPLLSILQNNVVEFIPYVLQLVAQMLELRKDQALLPIYEQLLRPILTPDLWDSRGNIPALVRLMQAFLSQSPNTFIRNKFLEPVLGIFQKLIASKANDAYGMDLLGTIYTSFSKSNLEPYNQQIFLLLLTRLNNSNTEKFTLRFVVFIYYLSASDHVGPDFIVSTLEGIQNGIFAQIFQAIILPNTQKIISSQDLKSTSLGLTSFLFKSQELRNGTMESLWQPTLIAQLKFLELPALDIKDEDALLHIELSDVGFQASFAKLNTTSRAQQDPWPDILDPKSHFIQCLNSAITADQNIRRAVQALPQDTKVLLNNYGVQL